MKSRIFANLCLSLLLLFSQHIALADAVTHVRHTVSDHQCTFEEGASQDDGDIGSHVALDDIDNGLVSSFLFPAIPSTQQPLAQSLDSDFFSVVSQYYSTRAPPLL